MRGGGLWCPHQSPGAADMGRRVARRGAVAAPSGADDSADDGALGGTDDCALCAGGSNAAEVARRCSCLGEAAIPTGGTYVDVRVDCAERPTSGPTQRDHSCRSLRSYRLAPASPRCCGMVTLMEP